MKKVLLMILGTISLILGVIGIVLPVLPTTPLILLSLVCYIRSSSRLYNFVLSNKYLAPYVKDYISGEGIPIKAKKKAIFLIWITIGFSVIFIIDKIFVRLMLLGIATTVSIYIWTRETLEDKNNRQYNRE